MIFADTTSATNNCKGSRTGITDAALNCQVTSTSLTVNNWFNAADYTGPITITTNGVRNYRSMAPSPSFTYQTGDTNVRVIDEKSTAITTTMTSVLNLQGASLAPVDADKVNGKKVDWDVVITAQTPTADNDVVRMVFPTSVIFPTLSSDLTCTTISGLVSIVCTMFGGNRIDAKLVFTGGSIATGG